MVKLYIFYLRFVNKGVEGVVMKRASIFLLVLLVVGVSWCSVNRMVSNAESTELVPDCVVSNRLAGDYWLTIIANREVIEDKGQFAEELVEQVRDDGFQTIKFFFEDTKAYPTGLRMFVYLTEDDWQDKEKVPYMMISLKQDNVIDGYNIVEDYDRFDLEID